jgi:cell division ATPase FtsA
MGNSFLIETWLYFDKEHKVLTQKDCEGNFHTGVLKDSLHKWEVIGNFEKHITTNIHEALDKHLEYAEELKKLIRQNIKDNIEELIIKIHQIYSGINFLNNDYEMKNKITMLKQRVEDLLKILKRCEEEEI